MSNKELKTGKLDTKFLWGVASMGAVSLIISLIKHKMIHESERAVELEERTETRIRLIGEKVQLFQSLRDSTADKNEQNRYNDLIQQALDQLETLTHSQSLPLSNRLSLERCEESLAELEERLEQLDHPEALEENTLHLFG